MRARALPPHAIAIGIAFHALAPPAAAVEDWPTRPMTMVVAYAAGGPVDTIARLFGQRCPTPRIGDRDRLSYLPISVDLYRDAMAYAWIRRITLVLIG